MRCIHDRDEAVERLVAAARAGAAAVWIRNTVDSCREGAALLRERGLHDVMLFHARFAHVDRQRCETAVLERFGPESSAERAGTVLVATQVVEQSLDLDFDVMVSDLAPIDLLIQRAGRLWRHDFRTERPGAASPELSVLTPPFQDEPRGDWLDDLLPKTKWVYQDAGVMWRTLRALNERGVIDAPDGLRWLIEQVYDDDLCPEGLQFAADQAQGTASAATGTARQYVLKIGDGYVGESLLWSSDVRVPTRLNDHQHTVRLGRVMPDRSVLPWAEDPEGNLPLWHRWALSEVKVSRGKLPPGSAPEPADRAGCELAKAAWGRWEQEIPLVPLRRDGPRWVGTVVAPGGAPIAIDYDAITGLSISSRSDDAGR